MIGGSKPAHDKADRALIGASSCALKDRPPAQCAVRAAVDEIRPNKL
jgi:hypothetical protein